MATFLTLHCIVFQLHYACMYRAPFKRLIMNSLVQRIANVVNITFAESVADALFPGRYSNLLDLVGQIRDTDLNIVNPSNIMNDYIERTGREFTDVLEIGIAQQEELTMRVFILRGGGNIPVHDHPNILVILKMISGTAEVTFYNLADESLNDPGIPANARVIRRQNPMTHVDRVMSRYVGIDDVPFLRIPTEGSFYGIRAVGGDAAFFELLTPSYERIQRPWRFYNVIEGINANNQKILWLNELHNSPAWDREEIRRPIVNM